MFRGCSNIKEINFGKLDFSLVTDFSEMFYYCRNLVDLDVTNFNTKNSKSFYYMFFYCKNLKKIDVSKFNSSKCEDISHMFYSCKNITEIDMIDWDMSNLKYKDKICPFYNLFSSCEKLAKIKISGNINKEEIKGKVGNPFSGIPENGEIITSEKVMCNIPLDGNLPQNWARNKEKKE